MSLYKYKKLISALSGLTFLFSSSAFAMLGNGPRLFTGDNYFLAISNGVVWKIKNDGEAFRSDITSLINQAVYGNGFWLADHAGSFHKSVDGINWTKLRTNSNEAGFWPETLFFSNGKFYGTYLTNYVCTSTGGVNWKCTDNPWSSYTKHNMANHPIYYCDGTFYKFGEYSISSPSGSKSVTLLLTSSNESNLEKHVLNIAGYGSSTCIGNKIIFYNWSRKKYYSYNVQRSSILSGNFPTKPTNGILPAEYDGKIILDFVGKYILVNGKKVKKPLLDQIAADNDALLGYESVPGYHQNKLYISNDGYTWSLVK
ncbi:hypothetical protein [Candidatus Igneacidithiobacillus taiwanensis]|uniref:hypothetical protein n=1 Tax=Candidatus Igneacidithiobacillus taiwanensis TaxID=1945924 RepID=UPI0028A0C46A|nr:hypothetical protein [Candidatus Igneacidithiobacillus taiwanensis]